MEPYLLPIVVFVAGAVLSGVCAGLWFGRSRERLRESLEQRVRKSEGMAGRYQAESEKFRQEALVLRENLEKMKRAGDEAVAGVRQQFYKKVISTGLATFAVGAVLGTAVSGLVVEARTKLHMMERMMDGEVTARTAQARAEMLEERFTGLKEDYEDLRRNLLLSREREAVVSAKMKILLENLARSRVRNELMLDVEAMRENLRRDPRVEPASGSDVKALVRPVF